MRSLGTRCLIISLALVAAASACKKEGGSSAGGGAGGVAGAAGDDLNVIPADSDVVASIDLAKLRGSGVFKEFGEKLLTKATSELSEFKASCGFDPVDTIKSITLGMKQLDSDKPRGSVIIHTSAPKDKLKACLEKQKAEAESKGTTIRIEGDIAFIESKKDNDGFVAVTFLGSDGVVALINDSAWTKEKVAAALAGGGSIKSSKPFVDIYGAIKKGQTLWFYLNGESKMAAQAKAMGLGAVGFFGSIDVTDGLSSEFRARMKTPAEATAAADALKGQMAQAQMFFTKAEMKADGNDLRINVELTGSQLKGIASMVGGMVGRGAGGMGGGAMPADDMPAGDMPAGDEGAPDDGEEPAPAQ